MNWVVIIMRSSVYNYCCHSVQLIINTIRCGERFTPDYQRRVPVFAVSSEVPLFYYLIVYWRKK